MGLNPVKLQRQPCLCAPATTAQWTLLVQEWETALAGGKVKGNVSVKATGDSASAKKKRKVIHENDGSVVRNKLESGKKKKKSSKKGRK